ncbi:MAG: hypothetical protein LBC67_04635 [Spirochaetales bacterium]|jgi:hypothetical protein|nr:hypothetical protein [Spirochaetales bacterium]
MEQQTEAIGAGLTFEKVWAAIQANGEYLKETERQMKERYEETVRLIRERQEETDRQLNKRFGEFSNRFGEIIESMVVPNLVAKFRELGFEFTKAGPDVVIKDKENNIFTEIDAFLENGDKVMLVEIKTKPTTDDVDEHIERMEKMRRYADVRNDNRKYLGAIAGAVMSESLRVYALKKGFYVIEPSGETFNITAPGGKYRPREW